MGISGLLPLLKPIQRRRHLSEYSGQTIAVDAYVWLHKGVYGCAPDVATGRKTTKYVIYSCSPTTGPDGTQAMGGDGDNADTSLRGAFFV